jgi:hypothetical protein
MIKLPLNNFISLGGFKKDHISGKPPSFSGYNLREAPTPQFLGYNQKEATTPYVLRLQPEGGYNHLSLPRPTAMA